MRRWALIIGILICVGCRTGGTPPGEVEVTPSALDRKPPRPVVSPLVQQAPLPEPESSEPPVPLPVAVTGYDRDGPNACLPLAADRRCISRVDTMTAACHSVKGELRRCEDCSYLCSKLVK